MLTQERADLLTEILNADEERAQILISLGADEAAKQINALGNDFTAEEVREYGKALKAATTQGELDAESLDDVAGGKININWNFSGRISIPQVKFRSPIQFY